MTCRGQALVAFLMVLCGAPRAWTQVFSLRIDPARSSIRFVVRGVLHSVHGSFQLDPSVIECDAREHSAGGTVVVLAGSGHTGNSAIDRRMADILDPDRYQVISFWPARFEGSIRLGAVSEVEVSGVMRLHGAEHAIRVPVEVAMTACEFSASGRVVVPYVAWGLRDPSTFMFRLRKEVEIEFHIAAAWRRPDAAVTKGVRCRQSMPTARGGCRMRT